MRGATIARPRRGETAPSFPPYDPRVKRLGFRARLFLILLLFAVLPAAAMTLIWSGSVSEVLPLVSGSAR